MKTRCTKCANMVEVGEGTLCADCVRHDAPLTYNDLLDQLRDELSDAVEGQRISLAADADNYDVMHEIVDGLIPVYHYRLLEVAMSKLDLATCAPEAYGFNGEHTAVNAIAGALYDELYNEAVAWYQEEFERTKGIELAAEDIPF